MENLDVSFDFGICITPSPVQSSSNKEECSTKAAVEIDSDIDEFIANSKSKSTTYSTNSACNRLQTFMKKINPSDTRNFYELSINELDQMMCQFFMNAEKVDTKSNGGDTLYQPDTLNSFRNAGNEFYLRKDEQ